MRSNRTESTIYFLFTGKESKQRKARYRGKTMFRLDRSAFLKKSLAKTETDDRADSVC